MITIHNGHIIIHNITPTNEAWELNVKIIYWYGFFKSKKINLNYTIDLDENSLITRKKLIAGVKKLINELDTKLKL